MERPLADMSDLIRSIQELSTTVTANTQKYTRLEGRLCAIERKMDQLEVKKSQSACTNTTIDPVTISDHIHSDREDTENDGPILSSPLLPESGSSPVLQSASAQVPPPIRTAPSQQVMEENMTRLDGRIDSVIRFLHENKADKRLKDFNAKLTTFRQTLVDKTNDTSKRLGQIEKDIINCEKVTPIARAFVQFVEHSIHRMGGQLQVRDQRVSLEERLQAAISPGGIGDAFIDTFFGKGANFDTRISALENKLTTPRGSDTSRNIIPIAQAFLEFVEHSILRMGGKLHATDERISLEGRLQMAILPGGICDSFIDAFFGKGDSFATRISKLEENCAGCSYRRQVTWYEGSDGRVQFRPFYPSYCSFRQRRERYIHPGQSDQST